MTPVPTTPMPAAAPPAPLSQPAAPDGHGGWPGLRAERIGDAPRPARVVAIGYVAVLLGLMFGVGFAKVELFPFSDYPMFSKARLDPDIARRIDVFGYAADGTEHAIEYRPIAGPTRMLRRDFVIHGIRGERIDRGLDDLVERINRMGLAPEPIVGLRLLDVIVEQRPYPGNPLDPIPVRRRPFADSAPDNARISSQARRWSRPAQEEQR